MTPERARELADVARMVRDDAVNDSARLDGKPFNGAAVAETFGETLAMVHALAGIVIELCEGTPQ